jgi:hypothetical protein
MAVLRVGYLVSVALFEPEQARKHSLRRDIKPDFRIKTVLFNVYCFMNGLQIRIRHRLNLYRHH